MRQYFACLFDDEGTCFVCGRKQVFGQDQVAHAKMHEDDSENANSTVKVDATLGRVYREVA